MLVDCQTFITTERVFTTAHYPWTRYFQCGFQMKQVRGKGGREIHATARKCTARSGLSYREREKEQHRDAISPATRPHSKMLGPAQNVIDGRHCTLQWLLEA